MSILENYKIEIGSKNLSMKGHKFISRGWKFFKNLLCKLFPLIAHLRIFRCHHFGKGLNLNKIERKKNLFLLKRKINLSKDCYGSSLLFTLYNV